ncbi:MAG: PilZ domain-containing protein [Deltaproteobacteria bacterium]|nr:PilZ domain-containing protein [Deltaproteobacteria bacterium]
MISLQDNSDKRRSRRFPPDADTLAMWSPGFKSVGIVKDISRGGLGCEYFPLNDDITSKAVIRVDLFVSGAGRIVRELECLVVYDIPLAPLADGIILESRRAGLEFQHLTREQETGIERFIENRTAARESTFRIDDA